jgi:hypothetical protein
MPRNEHAATLRDAVMKAGRELELLVAAIKRALHPNAKVESPGILKDRDTGEDREVDVLVTIPTGPQVILIAVECRDRAAKQDVTWIEQLIAKKESIGVDLMIAVTSSEFYRPALFKAAKRGVAVRQLVDGLAEEISSWAEEAYIEIRSLILWVSETILETKLRKVMAGPTLRFRTSKRDLDLDQVISLAVQPNIDACSKRLSKHGEKTRFNVKKSVDGLIVCLPYEVPVLAVQFECIIERRVENLPLASGFAYEDAESARRLMDGYRFGAPSGVSSEVLIDAETKHGRWVIDLRHVRGLCDSTILKAGKPVRLTSAEILTSQDPRGAA